MAGHITLGQFVAFTVYLGMLNWPMVALGWVINLFQRGIGVVRGASPRSSTCAPAIAEPAAAPSRPPACRGELEFRDLTFTLSRRDRARAARRLVPRARPGATVALVGPHRLGQEHAARAAAAPVRSAAGHGVRSTASTCATLRPRVAARASIAVRAAGAVPVLGDASPRTSPTASTGASPRGDRARRRASRTSTATSRASRTGYDTLRRRARHHALGRPEAARRASRARCCATRRSCCSTTACRASTRTPRRPSCAGCAARCGGAPRCSSRTA